MYYILLMAYESALLAFGLLVFEGVVNFLPGSASMFFPCLIGGFGAGLQVLGTNFTLFSIATSCIVYLVIAMFRRHQLSAQWMFLYALAFHLFVGLIAFYMGLSA